MSFKNLKVPKYNFNKNKKFLSVKNTSSERSNFNLNAFFTIGNIFLKEASEKTKRKIFITSALILLFLLYSIIRLLIDLILLFNLIF